MRKVLLLGIVLVFFSASFPSSNVETPVLKADQMFFPVGNTGKKISYAQLATISVAEMQTLTGRKMSAMERINFHLAQRKMRKSIAVDGTVHDKKITKFLTTEENTGKKGFHIGGFALGFFLGVYGIIIAYLIDDDYKRSRVKWAWIGLITLYVVYFGIMLMISGAFYL